VVFQTYPEKLVGVKERMRGPKFNDHYSQATLYFNSITPVEQEHVIYAAIFELSHVSEPIQKGVLEHFVRISHPLTLRVAEGLGISPPEVPHGWVYPEKKSASLSMVVGPYIVKTPASKKVALLVGDGYDSVHLHDLISELKKVGALPSVIGTHAGHIKGSKGESVKADGSLFNSKSTPFDAVFVVGGEGSVASLSKYGESVAFVNEAFKYCKPIGASGEAVQFLEFKFHLPGIVYSHGNETVSSFGVVTSAHFQEKKLVEEFIVALSERRFWARSTELVP